MKGDLYKLSVLEPRSDGMGWGFRVYMTAIPTRENAEFLADLYTREDGLTVRVSKHINPRHDYYYGKLHSVGKKTKRGKKNGAE